MGNASTTKEQFIRQPEAPPLHAAGEELIRLSSAINVSPDGIAISDMEGKITYVNKATLRMYGTDDPKDLLGRSSFELIAPEDREKAFAGMKETMEKGYSSNKEYHVVTKSGNRILAEMSTALIKSETGEAIGFVAAFKDVTERKRMERALNERVKELQCLYDIAYIVERPGTTLDELCQEVVNLLPPAWQYPEITCARVTLGDKEFRTDNFKAAEWKQSANINIKGQKEGTVEVYYLEARPKINEGPFLKEERLLIDVVAGRLGRITERKQAEEALRESEERYRALVNLGAEIGEAVIMLQDTEQGDGIQTFASDQWSRITGYSKRELLGMSFFDLIHPKHREVSLERHYRKVRGEVMPRLFEMTIIRKDGTEVLIELTSAYTMYKGKHANVVYIRDITERKQVEEKLRESEGRFRSLVESTSDWIWQVDANGIYTYSSPAVKDLLGYEPKEILDKTPFDLMLPEEAKRVATEFQAKVESKEPLVRLENTNLHKDGRLVEMETSGVPIYDSSGSYCGYQGIDRDITERKRTEEKIRRAAEEWRTTFDSITDLVSILDRDCRLLRVNKAFADTFKMNPRELIGKTCYEVIHGAKEPMPNCPHQETLKTKKPARAEFFEPHLRIHLEVSTSPIFNEEGEVIASVYIARDITERKQAEVEKRELEQRAQLVSRLASVGEMASGIAHEINNPLTSVIGFSQLLIEGEIPDDIREDLGIVCSEAQRAAEIVKNLLTFARKREPVKQLTTVNSIVEGVLKLRDYEQKVNNIQVITQFDSILSEVMIDYSQMQQVFLNIIINAEDAMLEAHGQGTLTITTQKVNSVIRASFTDDGPGIAKETLNRIFDPFFTTKEVGKGTGLGLSICHGVVSEHGGTIYAKSKLGKGATFVVELPIDAH